MLASIFMTPLNGKKLDEVQHCKHRPYAASISFGW